MKLFKKNKPKSEQTAPQTEAQKKKSSVKKLKAKINESGLFIGDWYKNHYLDIFQNTMDPLRHYAEFGINEGRRPNPFFDPVWYRSQYIDEIGEENPFLYYLDVGQHKGHDPSSTFNAQSYLELNPDVAESGMNPLVHYLHHGRLEGRFIQKKLDQKNKVAGAINDDARLPIDPNLRTLVDYERVELAPASKTFNAASLDIHFVIPDFAPGGGGHMTIFRMAHFLEVFGHKVTIWINNPEQHATADDAYNDIIKHFQHLAGEVKFLDSSFSDAKGDALIATDCFTVWPCLSNANFKRRFYFVQDFEPSFHPMGTHYLVAENTYRQGLDCICASPWLADKMQKDYGLWARYFWLAADQNIYKPAQTKIENKIPRIAIYARHFTARRAVELAMLSLEVLAKRGVKFHVDFFGAPLNFTSAPFPFTDHGVASPMDLAEIFKNADIGVVFSATNYSLVPQEMMACGLPLLELDGESTRAIFPTDTVRLAKPDPIDIADKLEKMINTPEAIADQAKNALAWLDQFSWQSSARLVEKAILDRLTELFEPEAAKEITKEPYASVVIPTLNAGPEFDKVLAAVCNQQAPWPFEILVIDSGSTDGTLDIIKKYHQVRLHQIDKKDFSHGGTRNLGVELTSGDYIAFLTHDALPANDRWLHNLVTSIEHYPNAAGAFGKHLPWPDASPFTKRDLNAHFEMMASVPIYLDKDTDSDRYNDNDARWKQVLHFYSDNNSCMRRDVWKKIPYQIVAFGEDQLWADDVIKAGYGKVYAAKAVVYHSHDFDPEENYERNKTESAFFKHFFGYELVKNEKQLAKTVKDFNIRDKEWGEENDLSTEIINKQQILNESRLKGYLDGAKADTKDMF